MAKYKDVNYNQTAMVVLNFEEQLQPGTFEHAINYLIDKKIDLSAFDEKYKNDETGRPAYHPALMLKIILFAYSKGITSSREIQWCCEHNIIFKALSGDTIPHYTSIATFVRSFPRPMELLFEQILLICFEQGLLGNELFAIDGCKMSSNAAKEWSGTFKELSKKRDKIKRQLRHAIKKHKKLDKQDPDNQEAITRLQQTIETLDSAEQKIDEFLKTHEPGPVFAPAKPAFPTSM